MLPSVVSYIQLPKKVSSTLFLLDVNCQTFFGHTSDPKFLDKRRQELEVKTPFPLFSFFQDFINELVLKTYNQPGSPFFSTDRTHLMKSVPFFRPGESLK
jgi:hypothetical protein